MARTRIRPIALSLLAATLVAGCASTQRGPTEWDGLVRKPGTRLDAVFVRPDVEIPAFRSVMIDPVTVSFASNWDPNARTTSPSRRLDAGDIQAIQDGLATMFRDVFREELARGGYQLVDQPGPDTLRVTPAIVDLFISAPDTMTPGSRTYTANAGRMTLVVELRDSVTGELLARAVDARGGRNTGTLSVTNRVTNTADARRAIGVWATALRSGLDDLYQRSTKE
jgi:hypothetical protein